MRYGVEGEQNTQTVKISGGIAVTAAISNLMPLMTYEIKVAAVNSAGTGMFSPVMIATT